MTNTDSLTDLETLALTIYGEARGEKVDGQIAIGCVIRNRRISHPEKSYKDICLAPKQFSCWNENDPNRVILLKLADNIHGTNFWLKQTMFIASGIIDNNLIDNTGGAKNYMTSDLFFSDKKPAWAIKAMGLRTIGNHVFFTVL